MNYIYAVPTKYIYMENHNEWISRSSVISPLKPDIEEETLIQRMLRSTDQLDIQNFDWENWL